MSVAWFLFVSCFTNLPNSPQNLTAETTGVSVEVNVDLSRTDQRIAKTIRNSLSAVLPESLTKITDKRSRDVKLKRTDRYLLTHVMNL